MFSSFLFRPLQRLQGIPEMAQDGHIAFVVPAGGSHIHGDDAVIIRLTETAGQKTDGEITLFFTPAKVVCAANDETDIQPIQTNGNRVTFSVQPYSCVTLKVYGDFS